MNARDLTLAVILSLSALSLGWTQEKHSLSFLHHGDAREYVQDYRIDVGDVEGHIVRVAELSWDMTKMDPVPSFNGVKATFGKMTHLTDYQDFNGDLHGYMVFDLETGEKIFSSYTGTTLTAYAADGTRTSSVFSGVFTLTGGTGHFADIRGVIRQTSNWNLSTDTSLVTPTTFEGEYWFIDQNVASR